jgi:hypothetical protein
MMAVVELSVLPWMARAETGAVGRVALCGAGRRLVQIFATANLRSESVGYVFDATSCSTSFRRSRSGLPNKVLPLAAGFAEPLAHGEHHGDDGDGGENMSKVKSRHGAPVEQRAGRERGQGEKPVRR